MKDTQKFLIWAPNYNELQGGSLVLHYLCHYLNFVGYKASIWPKGKLLRKDIIPFEQRLACIKRELKKSILGIKVTSPLLNTPLASEQDLHDAIIVYPEKVEGNPLGAKKVVRWFLHKPGFHTGVVNYGKNELYFYYQKAFDDSALGEIANAPLYFPVVLETFKQYNFGLRSGTCFILRKGRDRVASYKINNKIMIDGMSNQEIAKVFNESEFCVSYDLYTYYSQYAAICGCKSIVVPEPGLDKKMWQPKEELRYGIAYGKEDLEWATSTRSNLIDYIKGEQQITLEKVRKFAEHCCSFFNHEKIDFH